MNIGLIAQPHTTGIGHQTWEFARAMNPRKVLITDLTTLHARAGKVVKRMPWFEQYDHRYTVVPNNSDIRWILQDIDVLFVVETPLAWDIFSYARQRGVRTVLQYNYEFLEYLARPNLPLPDILLAPSRWYLPEAKKLPCDVRYIPVPVAADRIQRFYPEHARFFVHIAGHSTYADRNGTEIVMEAAQHVKSDVVLWIYHPGGEMMQYHNGNWVGVVQPPIENYWDLYPGADVLVLPRRYGGLSLQAQEAAQSGMALLMGKQDPYSKMGVTYPVTSKPGQELNLRAPIQTHDVSPQELAKAIDEMAENPMKFRNYSRKASEFADAIKWSVMKDEYLTMMEEL